MRRILLWVGMLAAFSALAMACTDEAEPRETGTVATDASPSDPLDSAEILDNVDDVRAMLAGAASGLDPAMVEDVDYSDGTLRLTLAEAPADSATSDFESICTQVNSAIALPDLKVVIEQADGTVAAECSAS